MYDDDVLFDLPEVMEPQDEPEPRLAEHEWEEQGSLLPGTLTVEEIEAALAVWTVLEMDGEDEDGRPLFLN